MKRSKISGTGSYLPPRVVTNFELEKLIDTSDEWVRQRTGIEERRYVDEGQGCADMALNASLKALDDAGLSVSDVDFIVLATLSPDYFFPGVACFLQDKLGCSGIGALDVRTQCTGFIYSLSIADQFIKTGMYRNILVVGVEIHSTGLDFTTRGREMTVLFGDGAGAVVVTASEEEAGNPSQNSSNGSNGSNSSNGLNKRSEENQGIFSTHLHADGKFAKYLWTECPASILHPRLSTQLIKEGRHYPEMNGKVVFRHAVKRFPEVINEALNFNDYKVDDIDLLILHQANLRINEFVAQQMGIPEHKVFNNIRKYGNTTAASIPIAIDEAVKEGRLKKGDLLCLASFGSGFTWASALIRW